MGDDLTLEEDKLPDIHHVGFIQKIKIRFLSMTSREKFTYGAVGIVAVLLIVLGSIYLMGYQRADSSPAPVLSNQNSDIGTLTPEEPKDQELPLSGVRVTQDEYNRLTAKRPLAIVIENHPDARPQIGLINADVIFETLTEGGITRFIAMFQSKEPNTVGPVRSMRKYFLDFTGGMGNPVYMHIGFAQSTNPEANAYGALTSGQYDTLGFTNAFWRTTDRLAPHNAYVNPLDLWSYASERGWTTLSASTLWNYKDPALTENPVNPVITVDWGDWADNGYDVTWKYNPTGGKYLRSYGDVPHVDGLEKTQLFADTVVVAFTDQQIANDDSARITINSIGSGRAIVFEDGSVVNGTWYKESAKDIFRIKDSSNKMVQFNRGVTWFMVVPQNSNVTY